MLKNCLWCLFVVVAFLLGSLVKSGAHYTLDIYAGSVRYSLPLEYANSITGAFCKNPEDKVVIALTAKSVFSKSQNIAGLNFCGQAYLHSVSLVQL